MASDTTKTTTATTSLGYSNGADSKPNASASAGATAHPQRRRIVKAAPPPKVEHNDGTEEVAMTWMNQKKNNDVHYDDEEEGDLKHGRKHRHDSNPIVEDEQEIVEGWREERMKATQNRSKALREKELAERRKNGTSKTADASANPFSRFLSVFSVEPKHPEHKRSFEGSPDVDEDIKGPSEKRLKASEGGNDADSKGSLGSGSSSNNTNKPWGSLVSSKLFWVSTAAAALAVGIALALRRGGKK